MIPHIDLIVFGVFALGCVLVFASKVLDVLRRIARAVEVEPVVATLESTSDGDFNAGLRKQIAEIEAERKELLGKVVSTATEIADESSARWKKEIERLDRTIERASVRPKRPRPEGRPVMNIDDSALEYRCACGWVGAFASSDAEGEKTLCPKCAKEIPA